MTDNPSVAHSVLGSPDLHWSSQRFEGKGLVAYREGISTPSTPYLRQAALTIFDVILNVLTGHIYSHEKCSDLQKNSVTAQNNPVNFIDCYHPRRIFRILTL